ncbi:hypothetical protein AB4371_10525 [Vibrio sp. 10N.261.51.A3]|nr:hypothetical protein [Vibrio sp. F13]TKF87978.1 hypothetical protein FCV73_19650 [Vibrio sp. F13]
MARRSILARNSKIKLTQREARVEKDFNESWLEFKHLKRTINLSELFFKSGNKSGIQIPKRIEYVKNVARGINLALMDKGSTYTFTNSYYSFRRYVYWCDKNKLDPFSRDGYLGYVGDDGKLKNLIKQNDEALPFLFDYDDGDKLGITEKYALNSNGHIRKYLKLSGAFDPLWDSAREPFSEKDQKLTISYSSDVTKIAVKRLSNVFDSLFNAVKEHYLKCGNTIPDDLTVEVTSLGEVNFNGNTRQCESPINTLMLSGYALFCFYTALNQSVILKSAHPIIIDKRNYKDKTIKMISLSLWKTRSGKFVASELTDEVHDINKNEFDVDVEKKTGVNLVEKLVEIAEMFGTTEKGAPLFWNMSKNSEIIEFDIGWMKFLSEKLNIKPIDTTPCNHIFAAALSLATKNAFLEIFSKNNEEGERVVSKKTINLTKGKAYKEVCSCAIALISSYNEPESFYGAKIPLTYTKTEGGFSIGFENDIGSGEFYIPAEYEQTIRDLESWAMSFKENKYLIPLKEAQRGRQVYVWNNPKLPPSLHQTIKWLGIGHGHYYLDLTSRRFRSFTAEMLYSDEDMGAEGSLILDNDINTFDVAYSGGNPEFNQLIFSQALEVASLIFKGIEKEKAKEKLLKYLKKEVLAYDKLIADKMYFNQNGFACNGKPDINKDIAKDLHRSASLRAENLGVGQAKSIPCYQLDQCCYCNSAKMADDENQIYKMISFVEILKNKADQKPDDESELMKSAHYLMLIIHENIPHETINNAQKRLLFEGLHPLVRSMDVAELII